jgi:uncharacterized protein DUF6985
MAKRKPSTKKPTTRSAKPAANGIKLPPLKWTGYGWTAQITVPTWRGIAPKFGPFDKKAANKSSGGRVTLDVSTPDDAEVPPSLAQHRAYDFLIKNQSKIRDAILKAVMKAYPKWLASCGIDDPATEPHLAHLPRKFKNVKELRSHIGLRTVYIVPAEKAGIAYVGYGFECSWDPEHGLGVATHRTKILEVGDEEAAIPDIEPPKSKRAAKKKQNEAFVKRIDVRQLPLAVGIRDRRWTRALLQAGAVPDKHYPGTVYSPIESAVAGHDTAALELLLQYAKRPLSKKLIQRIYDTRKPSLIAVMEEHINRSPRKK